MNRLFPSGHALRKRFGAPAAARPFTPGDRVVVIVEGKKRRGRVEGEDTVDGAKHLRIVLDPIDAQPSEDEIEEEAAEEAAPSTIAVPANEVRRLTRRQRA